jgi:hypothetical protein
VPSALRLQLFAGALGAAIIGAGCGSDTSDKAGGRAQPPATIRLHGQQNGFAPIFNTKGKQFVEGDQYAYTNKLTTESGKLVGNEEVFCVLSPRKNVSDCSATVVLSHGQITAQGVVDGVTRGTYAVIGGTGKYEGAHGTLKTSGPTRRGEEIVITLR